MTDNTLLLLRCPIWMLKCWNYWRRSVHAFSIKCLIFAILAVTEKWYKPYSASPCHIMSSHYPADTRRRINVGSTFLHRLRCWTIVKSTFNVYWLFDHQTTTQQARDIHSMLFQCWASIENGWSTLKQHCVTVVCLLGSEFLLYIYSGNVVGDIFVLTCDLVADFLWHTCD